jgi:nucleotide-binding universal stress UspA family protein
MNRGKRIVVAVRDEENGRIALQRALRAAQSPQDHLHLVHVSRTASWQRVSELMLQPAWMAADGESEPGHHGWLRRLSESAGAAGHSVEFEVLDGEPGKAVAAFARQLEADLIVVAAPRDGHARALLVGSTILRILRTASCPVLVARNPSAAGYGRALLAVDLDDTGQRVVHAANTWLSDTEMDLVHAFRVPMEGSLRLQGRSEADIDELRRLMQADAEARMDAYRAAIPRCSVHLEHGFTASSILDVVMRLNPDILVIGKHRGSNADERVIGSVAQFMLYNCATDILLVP